MKDTTFLKECTPGYYNNEVKNERDSIWLSNYGGVRSNIWTSCGDGSTAEWSRTSISSGFTKWLDRSCG